MENDPEFGPELEQARSKLHEYAEALVYDRNTGKYLVPSSWTKASTMISEAAIQECAKSLEVLTVYDVDRKEAEKMLEDVLDKLDKWREPSYESIVLAQKRNHLDKSKSRLDNELSHQVPKVELNKFTMIEPESIPKADSNTNPKMDSINNPRFDFPQVPTIESKTDPKIENSSIPKIQSDELPNATPTVPKIEIPLVPKINSASNIGQKSLPKIDSIGLPRIGSSSLPNIGNLPGVPGAALPFSPPAFYKRVDLLAILAILLGTILLILIHYFRPAVPQGDPAAYPTLLTISISLIVLPALFLVLYLLKNRSDCLAKAAFAQRLVDKLQTALFSKSGAVVTLSPHWSHAKVDFVWKYAVAVLRGEKHEGAEPPQLELEYAGLLQHIADKHLADSVDLLVKRYRKGKNLFQHSRSMHSEGDLSQRHLVPTANESPDIDHATKLRAKRDLEHGKQGN